MEHHSTRGVGNTAGTRHGGTYHRLAEPGVLEEDDRVELLDGQVFDRHVQTDRRGGTLTALKLPGLQIAAGDVLG